MKPEKLHATDYTPSEVEAAKRVMIEVAQTLPDDCTFDEAHYRLYLREMVERGLRAIDDGDYVSQEEAKRGMHEWRKSIGLAPH